MNIEITYNNGEKFTAYLTDKTYENVIACLLDDVSVSIMHSIGKEEDIVKLIFEKESRT